MQIDTQQSQNEVGPHFVGCHRITLIRVDFYRQSTGKIYQISLSLIVPELIHTIRFGNAFSGQIVGIYFMQYIKFKLLAHPKRMQT